MDLPGHRGAPDQADERRQLVQRGLLHRRAGARLDAPRRRGRRLAGGADDAGLRARPLRVGRAAGSAAAGSRSSPRPARWGSRPIPSSVSCWRPRTRTSASSPSSTGGPPSWPAAARPGPEGSLGKLLWTNGMTLNSDVDLAHPRRRPRRRHRRVGDVRVGRARARRARATGSPAGPTRSSATSSASACSASRRSRASTRTWPSRTCRARRRRTATPIKEVQMRDDETFHHRDRCAISGIGWTDFSRSSGRSELTLATQASLAAISDAGLTPQDIDGIVRCDMDLVRPNDLVDALGHDAARLLRGLRARRRRAVRPGRPGGGGDRLRPGDQRARLPGAERPQRPPVRAQLGDVRPGRRQRDLRRVLPALRAAVAGTDLRAHRPAPHDRVRDQREGPRRHRHRLPQPGQRQPPRPDARPGADDGRLPGGADDLPAAAPVRLLPGDRRCRGAGGDERRAGQGRAQRRRR